MGRFHSAGRAQGIACASCGTERKGAASSGDSRIAPGPRDAVLCDPPPWPPHRAHVRRTWRIVDWRAGIQRAPVAICTRTRERSNWRQLGASSRARAWRALCAKGQALHVGEAFGRVGSWRALSGNRARLGRAATGGPATYPQIVELFSRWLLCSNRFDGYNSVIPTGAQHERISRESPPGRRR